MHTFSKRGVTTIEMVVIAIIIGILAVAAIPLVTGVLESGADRKAIAKVMALNLAKENFRIIVDNSYVWWTDGISDGGGSNDDEERWVECLGGASDPRGVRTQIWVGEMASMIASISYLNPSAGTPAYMPTGYRATLNGLRDKSTLQKWDGATWQTIDY